MATTTLRPNATVAQGGSGAITLVGAATNHAATSDNSDSSYFRLENFGPYVQLGFTDLPTLPAGTVIKAVTVRGRTQYDHLSFNAPDNLVTSSSISGLAGNVLVNWQTPNTITLATLTAAIDPTTINAAWVQFQTPAGAPVADAYRSLTRIIEAYLDVVYVPLPVVNVTGPTGTITDANRPSAQWTATLDADGGPQTQYHVKVYTAAQYGAGGFNPDSSSPLLNSGIQAGTASSWQFTTAVDNDTYRSYVRVAQTVNGQVRWSAWDYAEYEIDVAAPAAPDVDAVANNDDGRMEITLTATSGAVTTDSFELERSDDGGASWVAVRGAHPVDNPAPLILDYEAPGGGDITYRARALHDYAGSLVASGWTETTVTSWVATAWWIKHPTRPELNMLIRVRSFPQVSRASRVGIFQALGAHSAVAISDARGPITGTITLRIDTLADQQKLDALLNTGDPLLLQSPPGEGAPPGFIAVSNHTRTRIADWASAARTFDALDFTTVSSPVSAAG